jgi:acyl carrier protein
MTRDFLTDVTGFLKDLLKEKVSDLTPDTALIASGIMDSLDIIALIEFIENHYQAKLSDAEMVPENFEAIASIVALLQKKIR